MYLLERSKNYQYYFDVSKNMRVIYRIFLAAAVFELAMFGIMVLFLSFCGFFTFKHCFFIWRKKKRRRHDDSLESILDLLYNEDYYYLESSVPYLPPPEDKTNRETPGGSVQTVEGDSSHASFASAPTQGRSVKWNGSEKIAMHKYKVMKEHVMVDIKNQYISLVNIEVEIRVVAYSHGLKLPKPCIFFVLYNLLAMSTNISFPGVPTNFKT